MKKNNHAYFKNADCEYFPCHKTSPDAEFNCLFCYCPLYALGEKCGGNYTYLETGIKDCSGCMLPHSANGYGHVLSKFSDVAELAKRKAEQEN